MEYATLSAVWGTFIAASSTPSPRSSVAPAAISITAISKPGARSQSPNASASRPSSAAVPSGPITMSGALRPGRSPYFHAKTNVAKSEIWSR